MDTLSLNGIYVRTPVGGMGLDVSLPSYLLSVKCASLLPSRQRMTGSFPKCLLRRNLAVELLEEPLRVRSLAGIGRSMSRG